MTLIELSDPNNPLLRKLAEKAAGTFQHSLQVANLAEEAIVKLRGNSLMVRVGALYHDIGKMNVPEYFTENQIAGFNPHNKMTETESAQIIIKHVTDGEKMAKKAKLPQAIIDFIVTHHGTTRTEFFYRNYKTKNPDIEIDESLFTYPGPKPFSKETAVLMMADSIEAASRSLPKYTDEAIDNLVDKIVDYQVSRNQFEETPLYFKHIKIVKDVFKQKLKNIYHSRIAYPEES
jgi:putative nucleotidyltransferase with HDIG domain